MNSALKNIKANRHKIKQKETHRQYKMKHKKHNKEYSQLK
jgi:hypothetical protein